MSKSGWDEMLCNYFYKICIKILGGYFSGLSYTPHKDNICGVVFNKQDVFVEISYSPDSFPNYFLRVVVGVGYEAYDDQGCFTGLPLWKIIPENDRDAGFLSKTFSNEEELADLLTAFKNEIFDKYVSPLLQDKNWLEKEQKNTNL